MKRLLLIIISAFILNLLFGCAFAHDGLDESYMREKLFYGRDKPDRIMQNLLEFTETSDSDAIIGLFAEDIASLAGFDSKVLEYMDFFQGCVISYDSLGGHISNAYDYGNHMRTARYTYEVLTDMEEYYLAIMYVSGNAQTNSQYGIHSVYIIRAEDANPDVAYWGDHKWSPGITIEG